MKELLNKFFKVILCAVLIILSIYILSKIPFIVGAVVYVVIIIVIVIVAIIFWIQFIFFYKGEK